MNSGLIYGVLHSQAVLDIVYHCFFTDIYDELKSEGKLLSNI